MAETRYASSAGGDVAYQIIGDGSLDLLYVPGQVNHIESTWDEPMVARHCRRLASFSRLIIFDKRGTGLSDRLPHGVSPTLEERMDDARAVLDAVSSERAAVFAMADGVQVATLFAVTYPERVQALVLYAASARMLADENYPVGVPAELVPDLHEMFDTRWGNEDAPTAVEILTPSLADDPGWRQSLARMQRRAGTPRSQLDYFRMILETDIRDILPAVRAPTLVLACTGDLLFPVDQSRYVAEHIPGARFVELKGSDHLYWAQNGDVVADEIAEFLTGTRHVGSQERVVATVLFTDIVRSTERASELGDSRWAEILEAHNAAVRQQLALFRGREVDTAGDGFFATFDGPARAIRCAEAIQRAVRPLGIEIRAGLHAGECELMDEKVGGIAVNVGARVAGKAGAGEVLVSRTVVDLVAGSGIEFADAGEHELKGVPGHWQLFRVESS
ncbi:MAG: adenylate/guanylate cyclase domain-containing protein [Solirubrobacteraceae bacterium]